MSPGADTSGVPWAGRQITARLFDGDTGEADPDVLEALLGVTERVAGSVDSSGTSIGVCGADASAPAPESALLERLRGARLLVPISASGRESDDAPAEMADVTLTGPDGSRALPAFTSVAAMALWDGGARPVPVLSGDAARSALDQGCDVIVLDLGSAHAAVLRCSMLWALAQDRPWVPAHLDPVVRAGVAAACAGVPHLAGADLAGDPGTGATVVRLRVLPGLTSDQVTALAREVSDRLAGDPDVRIRLDALSLQLAPA